MIATSLCGIDSELAPAGQLKLIGFETAESIDDINLAISDGSFVYVQAKATIDFSPNPGGNLRSVFEQFERQHALGSKKASRFLLVTTSRSSKKVVYELRAALEAFRLGPEKEFTRDQPRALVDIINELRRVLRELQVAAGRPKDQSIIDDILRRSFVIVLDIEAGDPVEQGLLLVLQSQGFAAPSAVWGKIVSDCVTHAKARHSIEIERLRADYDRFKLREGRIEEEASDDLLTVEFGEMNFSAGREVVLCRVRDNAPPLPSGLVLFEFYGFDDDCAERIKFSEDDITLASGVRIPLIRRAATFEGLQRMIEADTSLVGDEPLTIAPINSEQDFEIGNCAEIHRQRLRDAARANSRPLHCVHCGRPVSSPIASLVELGTLERPIVGLSHDACLKPSDRVLGTARGDFFESYPELVNFDANGWFRASHGGQITFANADVLRTQHKLIAWGGLNPRGPVGNYVIEIALQGGGREIVTQRNGVHRFDRVPAEKFASSLNSQFEESRKTGDPFCYSDQSKAFGRRSFLLEQLGGRERLVPVENARVRTYEERFAARYTRPGQWYAPLLYLRDPATDEPVAYENMVLLLTDPLTLRNFLVNWRSAELDVPTYETVSIHSDAEFDEFMRWVEARGWTAVVDPLLDPTDKNLVSGLPIRSVEALTNAR